MGPTLLAAALCTASSCGPRQAPPPEPPEPPPFPIDQYRALIQEGDRFFVKRHLNGWLKAEDAYERALQMRSTPGLRERLELTRLLRLLRQRQEWGGRIQREPQPADWCREAVLEESVTICRILGVPILDLNPLLHPAEEQTSSAVGDGTAGTDHEEAAEIENAPLDTAQLGLPDYLHVLDRARFGGLDAQAIETLQKRDPDNPLFVYLRFKSFDRHFDELEAKFPDFAELLVYRGEVYFEKEEPDPAIDHLARAIALIPDYPKALIGRANTFFFTLEDYLSAGSDFQRVLDLHPQHRSALYGMGLCLHYRGQYVASNKTLDRMLEQLRAEERYESLSTIRYYRGQGRYMQAYNHHLGGDPIEARSKIDEALRDIPESMDALFLSGMLSYAEHRLSKAEGEFTTIVEGKNGDYACRAHYYLGLIRATRREPEFAASFSWAASCLRTVFLQHVALYHAVDQLEWSQERKEAVRMVRRQRAQDLNKDSRELTKTMAEITEAAECPEKEQLLKKFADLIAELENWQWE